MNSRPLRMIFSVSFAIEACKRGRFPGIKRQALAPLSFESALESKSAGLVLFAPRP